MDISLGLILHSLPISPKHLCGELDHELTLSGTRPFLPDASDYSGDILYLADWKTLHTATAFPPYLVCAGGGERAAALIESNCVGGLVFDDSVNLLSILGVIQDVFLHYSRIERNLLNAMLLGAPIHDILDCCADFFENHIVLFDSDHNLIAFSNKYLPDENDQIWQEIVATRQKLFPLRKIIAGEHLFQDSETIPKVKLIRLEDNQRDHFRAILFDNSQHIVTMFIHESHNRLSYHQLKLVEYVVDILQQYVALRYGTFTGSRVILRDIFKNLIENNHPDEAAVRDSLENAGWRSNDDYRLVLISMEKDIDNITHLLPVYEDFFTGDFCDSVAVETENYIAVLLHNDSIEVLNANLDELKKRLHSNAAICGVSLPFCDIYQLSAHYKLTKMAIKHDPQKQTVRFYRDIMSNHITHELNSIVPIRAICDRGVIRIFEYDMKNKTELLKTLETYLRHNKSVKSAAEELFIHRGTIAYRLSIISRIANLRLNDPNELLFILLSCKVLQSPAKS